ncbi:MAG: hypothetical protein ACRCTI_04410 [Beijerinckiaceae bacterium]
MSRHHSSIRSPIRGFACATLIAAATVLQASGAMAQAAPAGLAEARKAWAAAVQKSDGPAAAALAVLPLQYEGYQAPRTIQRAAYLREVGHWSTLKACLANERMERVKGRSRLGTHTFNCDGHGFFFAERNGQWRLTGYENSNE